MRRTQEHTNTEEFDEEKRPLLFMACIISGNCISETEEEERTEEPRTREYNSLGEEKNVSAFYATSTMNAVSANLCNEGICQMFVENRSDPIKFHWRWKDRRALYGACCCCRDW